MVSVVVVLEVAVVSELEVVVVWEVVVPVWVVDVGEVSMVDE